MPIRSGQINMGRNHLVGLAAALVVSAGIVTYSRGDEKKDVCRLIVKESGGEKALGAKERLNPQVTEERIRLRQRRNEPDGWMILGLEGGAVEETLGPYVVSGAWWHREVHREYHFVRTGKTGWLWVYFDRRRRRWYLQGTVE